MTEPERPSWLGKDWEIVYIFRTWFKYIDVMPKVCRKGDWLMNADGTRIRHGRPDGKIYPLYLVREL